MVWVELELGQKVKMMTLQSNSHRSIETLVTSVTRVYQIEVDLMLYGVYLTWARFELTTLVKRQINEYLVFYQICSVSLYMSVESPDVDDLKTTYPIKWYDARSPEFTYWFFFFLDNW